MIKIITSVIRTFPDPFFVLPNFDFLNVLNKFSTLSRQSHWNELTHMKVLAKTCFLYISHTYTYYQFYLFWCNTYIFWVFIRVFGKVLIPKKNCYTVVARAFVINGKELFVHLECSRLLEKKVLFCIYSRSWSTLWHKVLNK